MRRLAAVTSEPAVVESQAIVVAGAGDHALAALLPGAELNDGPSNWFVPNIAAIGALCRAAGSATAEPVVGPPDPPAPSAGVAEHYRAVVHAHM